MPPAEVIHIKRQSPRVTTTLHGADQVEALFRELEVHLEAMPFLRADAERRFADRETLVMRTNSPVVHGGALMSVAPSAKLLAFLTRCRRLAQARGLRVFADPAPTSGPDLAEVVAQLMDGHGCDARLIDVAKALGLPSHVHSLGQGQGPL
ncbi:MAG: NAD(P)-dependent oxidoreductase [Desulfarculaceae bacterium]|nr:NAD(P)-dependent oxidoreductase [Desulfarculaceae bacterium]